MEKPNPVSWRNHVRGFSLPISIKAEDRGKKRIKSMKQ
jgi:hypothetical protein